MQKEHFIKKERIFGLDLLRAIAIIAVLLSHTCEFLEPLKKVPFLDFFIDNFIRFCQPLGQLGVELFFVLSGFLIGSIFLKTFHESQQFGLNEVRIFLVRRWFRTLPNYWLILTVNILLYQFLHLNDFEVNKLLFYIFSQNLWYPHPRFFFGEAWSLAVEEWFYLLFPISIYLSYRWLKPVRKRRFFLRALLSFIGVFILARILNAFHPIPDTDQDFGIRKIVLLRLDALAYGVLVAYLLYFKKTLINRIKERLFAIGIIGTIILYYLVSNQGLNICNTTAPLVKFYSDAFLYLLLPVVFALLLPYANSAVTTAHFHFKNGIQFISKISYSLYLVHYSLIYIPFFYNWKIENPLFLSLAYAGYWSVTITLSYLLYRFFEMPLMNIRDKFK